MATTVIPPDNPRLLDAREDVAELKVDVLALKSSHERLDRDLGKMMDKADKLTDKIAELSGDLREVTTKLGIVTALLGAVGALFLTQIVVFFFQRVQPAPAASAPIALAQPAPAVPQSSGLSADDIQKLKKLLDTQSSRKP